MTVFKMIEAVRMGVDKTSAFESAAFEEEEILYWLNEAQLTLIKQKVFGNNPRKQDIDNYSTGFKRPDDLSRLIYYSEQIDYVPSSGSPTENDLTDHRYHPNVCVANINPTNFPRYLFYIGSDFKATNANGDDMPPMEAVTVEMKDIGYFVETPYNKPYLKNAFIYLKEGEVNVIYDSFLTPVWLRCSYVTKPKTLVLNITDPNDETDLSDPEEEYTLPEQVHPEVVKTAVNMMLENVADPRYQSHTIELTKME